MSDFKKFKRQNWDKIRKEYESTSISIRQLCDKYKLTSYAYVRQKAAKWHKDNGANRRREVEIVNDYKKSTECKQEADVIKLWQNNKYLSQQLTDKLYNIAMGEVKATIVQVKAIELLGRRCGLFAEDNKQRNPLASLSKEERNKFMTEQAEKIGFIL